MSGFYNDPQYPVRVAEVHDLSCLNRPFFVVYQPLTSIVIFSFLGRLQDGSVMVLPRESEQSSVNAQENAPPSNVPQFVSIDTDTLSSLGLNDEKLQPTPT
ncbi:MAG: hypothetical protein ACJ762_06375 [Solirubrobacteraceae bacterium]